LETDPSPIRLVDLAPTELAAPVELKYETRRALTVDLATPLELDVRLPADPVLAFAIGASSRDRPTLLAPVVFRVLVDDTQVFQEILRRSQGEEWFPRAVDLARFSGRSARVVLEARRGEGGIADAERHVLAHWGNPVIRSRSHAPKKPNLVLISIDCLRADHVGAYGYTWATTPNLDAFARESTLFRNATASSSYTLPTHASMLTGLPPSLHGATVRRRMFPSVVTLPHLLAREGYATEAVVSGLLLLPAYGFAEGFDTYRFSSHRASGLVDQALALLDEAAGPSQFLFLHLFDAHSPYSPPGDFIGRFGSRPEDISGLHAMIESRTPPASETSVAEARALYDGEIAYLDGELGRFFAGLRERGLYDTSLIVVTSDHGEAFFERGHWEHGQPWRGDGPGLHQEIVHVPLLVKRPGAREGAIVEDVVSQMDVFPTLLEAAGSRIETPWARSLFGRGGGARRDWVLSEFASLSERGGATLEIALRRQNLKYLAFFRADSLEKVYATNPVKEAFHDLVADPAEGRNLLPDGGQDLADARQALALYLRAARESNAGATREDETLDPDLRRKLESLGYVER
jgi:arylsulfatase